MHWMAGEYQEAVNFMNMNLKRYTFLLIIWATIKSVHIFWQDLFLKIIISNIQEMTKNGIIFKLIFTAALENILL